MGTLLLLPSRQKRIHKAKALTKGFIATMYRLVVMFKLLNSLASPTLVRQLRHLFGPLLAHFSALYHPAPYDMLDQVPVLI